MIRETRLNNIVVRPFESASIDMEKVKGKNYLPEPYNLNLLCCKRKSGKSTAIGRAVLGTTNASTVFIVFSPNCKTDDTMVEILKEIKERGNPLLTYPSLWRGKEDLLQTVINAILDEEEEDEEAPVVQENPARRPMMTIRIGGSAYQAPVSEGKKEEIPIFKKTKKKPKLIAPRYVVIIDDLATELNRTHDGLANLCFNGRHLKMAIYISFQYKNQLPPALWAQATYIFIFKNFSRKKLIEIYESADLHSVTLEQFLEIYRYCTHTDNDNDRPFMMIETNKGIYRKNFNKKIDIE